MSIDPSTIELIKNSLKALAQAKSDKANDLTPSEDLYYHSVTTSAQVLVASYEAKKSVALGAAACRLGITECKDKMAKEVEKLEKALDSTPDGPLRQQGRNWVAKTRAVLRE